MKTCTKCKIEKDEKEFYKDNKNKDGLRYTCKLCDIHSSVTWAFNNKEKSNQNSRNRRKRNPNLYKEIQRKWLKNNPEKNKIIQRKSTLKRKYNISLEEYDNLLKLQNNVCATCGEPETRRYKGVILPLVVDHNHTTGAIRELLCCKCNLIIGNSNEDKSILLSIIKYLEKHKDATHSISRQ
jgi:hypothetical protein